jgi:hypothetical protein
MQLFLVYAYRNCSLTIPASARTHGKANFLKRGNIITDELLLEVRDQQTEGFDRMCVVFRNNASTDATDAYDAGKILNTSGGVSQIYTPSTDGLDLITNVISTNAESLPVTFIPSATEQEVELTASRLESLQSPEAVILEDLKTESLIDLTKDSYRFTTSPTDNPNRFVLHFKDLLSETTGTDKLAASSIRIAYASGELTLSGLQKADVGSRITVTDVQGRILMQEMLPEHVGETGKIDYRLLLSAGVYIGSLSGKRSLTTKFVR